MSRTPLGTTAEVRPADDIHALTFQIIAAERAAGHSVIAHAIEQGRRLTDMRDRLKPQHAWTSWLLKLPISETTVRKYLRAYEEKDKISLISAGSADMGLDKALNLLDVPPEDPRKSEDSQQSALFDEGPLTQPEKDEDDALALSQLRDREQDAVAEGRPDKAAEYRGEAESVAERLYGDNAPPIADVAPREPDYITLDAWNKMGERQRKKALVGTVGTFKFNAQGDNDNIEWALWSWNPVTGCLHNCPYCYARDIAERFYQQKFAPTLWPARLTAPQNTTFPEEKAADWIGHKNVFVCSMADLFGRWVPREWIDAVLDQVRSAPQWNFLFLTKFPIRMAEFDFPENAWVGTTVDCQARVANAEKSFRKVTAGVKWLSVEPMIEPLTFDDLAAFDWVVIGGASRSSKTPEWHPPRKWVYDLERQAFKAGVRLYEKSNLWKRVRQYPGIEPVPEPKESPSVLRYLPNPEK